MKKIALVGVALALVAGSASAANSLVAGQLSLGVEVGAATTPLISGRYFIAKDLAIVGGLGFDRNSRSDTTPPPTFTSTATTTAMLIGIRKYLKTDDFAPFVGGVFSYSSTGTSLSTGGSSSRSGLRLAAEAGAEYFLGKQFSVEGKVQFAYGSTDEGAGVTTSTFGTATAGLGANFYF